MPSRYRTILAAVAVTVLVAGCSRDEEPIDVPTAQAEFCAEVETYLESIGDYGGLFRDVQLTVGDVKGAADELAPGLEAVTAAAEVFREAVEADPTAGVTLEIVEPETLPAVEQAEEDFARAADINDRTPVIEAGVEFSSAAYQLEVAWVRVFSDAGCLEGDPAREAEAQQWVAEYVAAIQTDLRTLGYYRDDVDGIYGPLTIAAVEQLQEDNGLPVTGLVDPPTQAVIAQALAGRESAQVGTLQAILIATGHYTGPVDGIWSEAVESSLMALQEDLGVPATGVVDAATLRALEEALAAAGVEPDIPDPTAPPPEETAPPPQTTAAPETTAAPDTTAAPETTTAAPTTAAPPPTTAALSGSVLAILGESGQFTRFLSAVDEAGLAETLSGPGPFTIFAPTDAAFEAAGELPSDPEALAALVLQHVVEDELDGFALAAASSLDTAAGGTIGVAVEQGLIVLDGTAAVAIANIRGGNGIAHAVNAVLPG